MGLGLTAAGSGLMGPPLHPDPAVCADHRSDYRDPQQAHPAVQGLALHPRPLLGAQVGAGAQWGGGGFSGVTGLRRLHRSAFPPPGARGFLRSCWCLTFQVHNIIIQQPYTAACPPPGPISTPTPRVPYPSCPLRPCPISGDEQRVVCLYEFAFVLLCLFPGELFKMPMPGPPHPAT